MTLSRRAFLAASSASVAALAGCTGITGSGSTPPATPNPPDGPVATAPLPGDAGTRYATMGTDGPVVTYFGNWKCPYCAAFSTGSDRALSLPTIVREYVAPGRLRLRFRAFAVRPNGEPFLGPDAPRAARAGLAVWHRDPDDYWAFHEYVMAHQPPESERWATTDRLVRFARLAGVDPVEKIRSDVEAGKYREAVRATTRAFADTGARGTPALLVGGDAYSPFEREATRDALDRLAGG